MIQFVLNDNPDFAFGSVGYTHFSASLPAPAAIWLLGLVLGLHGWMRRKSTKEFPTEVGNVASYRVTNFQRPLAADRDSKEGS